MRLSNTYSPWNEAVAYEALWAMNGATTKSIAEIFERQRGEAVLPSVVFEREGYLGKEEILEKVQDYLRDKAFSVQVSGGYQYPRRLRDAKYPYRAVLLSRRHRPARQPMYFRGGNQRRFRGRTTPYKKTHAIAGEE